MYQTIRINSDTAMNTPSKILCRAHGVTLTETLIPLNHEVSKKVYFLDTDDGHDFGSFPTIQEALKNLLNQPKGH